MLQLNTQSACVFISNALVLLASGMYRDALLFSFLFFTSVVTHEEPTFYEMHVLDQGAIYLVVLNGAWMVYKRFRVCPALIVAVSTFIATLYLYHYGKLTGGYCYDPHCGLEWHAFLHVVSSVGHHAIAAL
jgi:hypothetical protein